MSVLAAAGHLCGAAAGRYEGETWHLADPAEVRRAAAEITSEKYPDSDQATVESRTGAVNAHCTRLDAVVGQVG